MLVPTLKYKLSTTLILTVVFDFGYPGFYPLVLTPSGSTNPLKKQRYQWVKPECPVLIIIPFTASTGPPKKVTWKLRHECKAKRRTIQKLFLFFDHGCRGGTANRKSGARYFDLPCFASWQRTCFDSGEPTGSMRTIKVIKTRRRLLVEWRHRL